MKILVCGATGFIGNHLIRALLKTNNEISATGIEEKEDVKHSWINEVSYYRLSLDDKIDNVYEYLGKPDKVIFLTWAGLPNYRELYHFEENLFKSYFFLKDLVVSGLKDLSILGTCFEYGMQSGPLNEEIIPMPDNPYGLAKDTLRKFLLELSKKYPFDLKWIRLFYLYGEGQNKKSILEQLKTALGNNEKIFNMSGGEQLRDYLPVEEVAENISRIAQQDGNTGIVNCCSGSPISIRTLVENYLQTHGKNIELNLGYYSYPDYEPMAFWGDSTKLESILSDNKG